MFGYLSIHVVIKLFHFFAHVVHSGICESVQPHHRPAGSAGGLAASQAWRGVRHAVVGADRVPVLQRAGAAHVAL